MSDAIDAIAIVFAYCLIWFVVGPIMVLLAGVVMIPIGWFVLNAPWWLTLSVVVLYLAAATTPGRR